MEEKYKVSVIIPAYNVRQYIGQSLDSAINQTLSDIEIIVIDDGSTDGTAELLDQYAEQYPNQLRVIHQKNFGVSAARNAGIDLAQGKYLYFLDADDYLELNAMEIVYQKAEDNNLDLVLFFGTYFQDNLLENQYNHEWKESYNQIDLKEIVNGQEIFKNVISAKRFSIRLHLYLFKRSLFDKYKFYFDINISYTEDILLIFEYMIQSSRAIIVPQFFHHYRVGRPNSLITAKNYKKNFISNYVVLQKMHQYVQEFQLQNQNQFIQREINLLMGKIYGYFMGTYDMLTKAEKADQKEKIKEMKRLAKQHHCFGNIKCRLFVTSETGFHLARSMCNWIRKC